MRKQFADYEAADPKLTKKINEFVLTGKHELNNKAEFMEAIYSSSNRDSKPGNTMFFKP